MKRTVRTEPEASRPTTPADTSDKHQSRIRRLLPLMGSLQGYIGLLLVLAIGIGTKGDIFLNQQNITNAVGAFASRGILAVGETLVILTAGIDLSVGSLLGIASVTSALMLVDHHLNPLQIVIVCMVVGAFFGFCNGAGTAWLKIQPFVMTLAMLTIVRGIDRQASNNVSIGTQLIDAKGKLEPDSAVFQAFGTPGHNVFEGVWLPLIGTRGIYYPVIALVAVVVVFQFVLSKTKFGRHIYAVGGNPTAARLSGVNVTLVVIAVYTLAGVLAGFAGPIDAAYNASGDPLAGTSYELDAIAAAVIGGASLAGGRGTIVGTFVGALILTLLDNVLGLNAVSDNYQLIIKGLIVVLAVVIQRPDFLQDIRSAASRLARRDPTGSRNSDSEPTQPLESEGQSHE